ncbi:hypothetical protein LCGC14_0330000 [marine sediment metagenome]|uniref:THIF-type NAD/FAD binding fold domain-containing protein n=1 Tax=marine sediment metagenome TaxID=412755 RepID=A0A0F9TZH8_9ZZZZ
MTTLNDYIWVFVGCGGTFYAASPYLAVLRRRYGGKHSTIFIDPDSLAPDNKERQWPLCAPGVTKVSIAAEILGEEEGLEIMARFSPSDPFLGTETSGKPVLAIVNVDNDDTRLQVAEWLAGRVSPGIMVVSGCERLNGQCYSGIWQDGKAILDWRKYHEDVGEEDDTGHRCNPQDVRANALTGVCVGMCIEDVAGLLEGGLIGSAKEFWWETGPRTTSVWHTYVPLIKAVMT